MIDKKSNRRPQPAISPFQEKLTRQLEAIFREGKTMAGELMQKLFGVTQNWEKFRDIVRNNYDLGCQHLARGNIKDAILRFRLVVWLEPQHADGWYYLGCSYIADGNKIMAKNAMKRSLRLKPKNEDALYMLALASGNSMPAHELPKRIPPALSLQHFDSVAAHFTTYQLEQLRYQGHLLLTGAIRAALQPGRIDHVILDIGVGTGLCGPGLRDVAAHITGVDFSSAMLAEAMKLQDADGKKVYDALIKRELHEFLQEGRDDAFDIAIAASTMSYIGDVQPLFIQVARVLKKGGLFAFTADALADGKDQEFRFDTDTARFRFSGAYLRTLAAATALKEVRFEEVEIYPGYKAWLCVFTK